VYSLITVASDGIRTGLSARAEVWRPSTPGVHRLTTAITPYSKEMQTQSITETRNPFRMCGPDVLSLAKVSRKF